MRKADQYLTPAELSKAGLASVGDHVFISRRAVITHPENLHIGSRVRIDDFTLITGGSRVVLGDNVHLGTAVTINAVGPVSVGDFSGLASGVKLFTSDDDYSGAYLTGPTVPKEEANITVAGVVIHQHCVIGSNSVILPGASIEDGAAVGALSLVKDRLPAWGIYGGVPARFIKPRSRELLKRAQKVAPAVDTGPAD